MVLRQTFAATKFTRLYPPPCYPNTDSSSPVSHMCEIYLAIKRIIWVFQKEMLKKIYSILILYVFLAVALHVQFLLPTTAHSIFLLLHVSAACYSHRQAAISHRHEQRKIRRSVVICLLPYYKEKQKSFSSC